AGAPPVPRVGAVHGTMGKPQLPRRRAQEHIVPQLRGGPAPRQDNEAPAGHDPGLMAAFQRGIGLAEAQQHLEGTQTEPSAAADPPYPMLNGTGATDMSPNGMHGGNGSGGTTSGQSTGDGAGSASHATHADGMHMDLPHTDVPRTGATPLDAAHGEAAHGEPAHRETGHAAADYTVTDPFGSDHPVSDHLRPDHPGSAHTAPVHTVRAYGEPADPPSVPRAQSHSPVLRPVRTSEFNARPDGSAPAG
ncbi:hypothetical protein AB0D38_34570, partial [Streptomyces sp. NPDC048279]